MHEKITDIQNSFWAAYKEFMKTGNMREYNHSLAVIMERYAEDPPMREFCEDLVWSWAKIINRLKQQMLQKEENNG